LGVWGNLEIGTVRSIEVVRNASFGPIPADVGSAEQAAWKRQFSICHLKPVIRHRGKSGNGKSQISTDKWKISERGRTCNLVTSPPEAIRVVT
jgi:hypothetical protein